MKPPDTFQPVNYKPLAATTGRHLFVVGENFELFHFDLVSNIWNELPSDIYEPDLRRNRISEKRKTKVLYSTA